MAKERDHSDDVIKLGKDKAKEKFDSTEETNIVDFLKVLEQKDPEIAVLKELNDKYIFINDLGGKSHLAYKAYNEITNKEEWSFLFLETFKSIYSNRFINITYGKKEITVPVSKFWIEHPNRNTVESTIFDPSKQSGIVSINNKNYLNLWTGFNVIPKRGNWQRTKKHVYKILCNSDPERFRYVINWLAWSVQNPSKNAEVCLVFKGEKGTGKSFLFSQFHIIFGIHGMSISDRSRLVGKFSGHFRTICYLFCDEVYYPGDKEAEGRLKSIITQGQIDIEEKYRSPSTVNNMLHVVMCTNNDWVIPATKDERRYFIDTVDNKYAKNRISEAERKKYFTPLWDEMKHGGREAMLFDLLNCNIVGWHPRNDVPETKELQNQKDLSLNYLEKAMKQVLEDGIFPGEYTRLSYKITSEAFCEYLDKIEVFCVKFSSVRKTRLMKELGCEKGRVPGVGKIQWEFPELAIMRKNWDKLYGKSEWDNEIKWTIQKSEF